MGTRNPFAAPPVVSRRGGPAKQPLSRDAIVAEALSQLLMGGPGELSLRKVAAALDTGPASLYAYVDDLSELQALVLDRALTDVKLRGGGAGWRARLHALLKSYVRVLVASPALARIAVGTIAVGPNGLRIAESLLALLHEAGVEAAKAAWAVDLLVLYATAIAAEHAGGLNPGDPNGMVARAFSSVSARDYPHLDAARNHLLTGSGEERFAWALDVLLAGILNGPRPAASKAPRRKRSK